MIYYIGIGFTHFCCSKLPLLNGDIKDILDVSYSNSHSNLLTIYSKIIDLLESSNELNYPKCPKRIKKEYKRVLALYKYRYKMIESHEIV